MKSLLAVLILALAVQSRAYHYDKPQVGFQQEDVANKAQTSQPISSVIKGDNGKVFEVTMSASRKVYEAHLPPKEQVFIVQHLNQPPTWTALYQRQTNSAHPQPNINSKPNPGFYGNFQQADSNPQQHLNINSNQYNGAAIANNAQHNFNQFTTDSNYQQQQYLQHQQQKYYPQQQPQRSNNQLNSVNNHKYVSQSEASQLDVYPYKQIHSNPRPFTRIITKCDASGQCETQKESAYDGSGNSDFHHQQVLQQSKAHAVFSTDKCQNNFNYQYTRNVLSGYAEKAPRCIPIIKGAGLRDRRFFPYSEVVIPQYPHN